MDPDLSPLFPAAVEALKTLSGFCDMRMPSPWRWRVEPLNHNAYFFVPRLGAESSRVFFSFLVLIAQVCVVLAAPFPLEPVFSLLPAATFPFLKELREVPIPSLFFAAGPLGLKFLFFFFFFPRTTPPIFSPSMTIFSRFSCSL